ASPSDFELVGSEVMEIVIPEVGRIDDDILLTIKDDILCEKLLNVNLLITRIETFNDNPTPSDFYEFTDELSHIISPPEYDCFYFRNFLDPGDLMSILNSGIRENLSTTSVNLPIKDDHSPLLAYVVWILLAYLTYPIIPPYLHPFGNEDTIFDLGITINHLCSFKPGLSNRCGAFKKFNTH
nr:hypothetical protein [Tanacetum cinerariifolium]